jgi:electron transfer flavoprotein alpha subunit
MTVLLCSWGNAVEGGTEEALTLARKASQAAGSALDWLVIGKMSEQAATIAGKYGVRNLDRVNHAKLEAFGPDALVAALAQYCTEHKPTTILFNQNAAVRLVAPRLAGRLGIPVVMNAFDITGSAGSLNVSASAYGGDTHVVYQLAGHQNVISVATTAIVAEPAASAASVNARDVAVDLGSVDERFRVLSAAKTSGPRLEDANVIVSGGRGLGNGSNYQLIRDLAAALGGLPGASRAIVDEGWIDSSHQVGLTGKVTRPALYLAAGISGASQHMAGCSAAKAIVAINKDKDASIYRYARYGIVADCLEVLPELIKAAKA